MTWRESLEAWVAHTGDASWRSKCDDAHPRHRVHRAFVMHEACVMLGLCEGVPPPTAGAVEWPPRSGRSVSPAQRPTAAETMALLAAMKACPYRAVFPPCGCSGAKCGLKGGTVASHEDCFACIRTHGNP